MTLDDARAELLTLADELDCVVQIVSSQDGESTERQKRRAAALRFVLDALPTREPVDGHLLWRAEIVAPPEDDADIPASIKTELHQCAASNGRVSYWYLCHLWRRGRRDGRQSVVAVCFECGPVTAWDEDGCCLGCGDDLPNAHGHPDITAAHNVAVPCGDALKLSVAAKVEADALVSLRERGQSTLLANVTIDRLTEVLRSVARALGRDTETPR